MYSVQKLEFLQVWKKKKKVYFRSFLGNQTTSEIEPQEGTERQRGSIFAVPVDSSRESIGDESRENLRVGERASHRIWSNLKRSKSTLPRKQIFYRGRWKPSTAAKKRNLFVLLYSGALQNQMWLEAKEARGLYRGNERRSRAKPRIGAHHSKTFIIRNSIINYVFCNFD